MLRRNYLIMKVSDDIDNLEFLTEYPQVFEYPHLFVLDSNGSFLHSQNAADFEEGL